MSRLAPARDPGADLEVAAAALAAGEVVAVPTDTVYGLAVMPRSETARRALFELKGRPEQLALPVLVPSAEAAMALAAAGPRRGDLERLAAAFWPGAVTVVVPLDPAAGLLLGGDGASVGLRCPGHRLLLALLERTGPLAVTSANRHGEPPCTTAAAVRVAFPGGLGAVLDGGRCDGTPSSVVSLTGPAPVLLRAGPVGLDEVRAVLGAGVAR